jgi:ABC-type multidrug transport system fused ATPase/permease subunit
LVDAERLLDLLTIKPTVTDKPGAFDLGPVEGFLKFDRVSFSYGNKEQAVCDINLSAAPGDVIALVGSTGAGKSTLVKLFLRYYDVMSGCISIDGHDIRDITQSSLRGALGIVSQNPILFDASIMENLRYAKLDATDEEDRISSFLDGYLTNVGEQGVKLSGGEIQRLAIARAYLKNPSILILDEATSAVDVETEVKIQDALRCLAKGRTTLVIAHRLSTVVKADCICVLENGTITESGTHRDLLEKRGRYYKLWSTQLDQDEQKSVDHEGGIL